MCLDGRNKGTDLDPFNLHRLGFRDAATFRGLIDQHSLIMGQDTSSHHFVYSVYSTSGATKTIGSLPASRRVPRQLVKELDDTVNSLIASPVLLSLHGRNIQVSNTYLSNPSFNFDPLFSCTRF